MGQTGARAPGMASPVVLEDRLHEGPFRSQSGIVGVKFKRLAQVDARGVELHEGLEAGGCSIPFPQREVRVVQVLTTAGEGRAPE